MANARADAMVADYGAIEDTEGAHNFGNAEVHQPSCVGVGRSRLAFACSAALVVVAVAHSSSRSRSFSPAPGATTLNSMQRTKQPNVMLVLADDLDVMLNGAAIATNIVEEVVHQGTTLEYFFANTPQWCVVHGVRAAPNRPLPHRTTPPQPQPRTRQTPRNTHTTSCPSRAIMLTGRYTHNMNTPVVNNSRWGNCASALWSSVDEQHTLGTTMKELGYETAFFGKYLNEYGDWDNSTGDAYNQYAATPMTHVPPGWDRWVVRKGGDPYYWNYTISVDGLEEAHYVDSAVPKAGTPVSQFVVVRKSKTQHLSTCEPKYALCWLSRVLNQSA